MESPPCAVRKGQTAQQRKNKKIEEVGDGRCPQKRTIINLAERPCDDPQMACLRMEGATVDDIHPALH